MAVGEEQSEHNIGEGKENGGGGCNNIPYNTIIFALQSGLVWSEAANSSSSSSGSSGRGTVGA